MKFCLGCFFLRFFFKVNKLFQVNKLWYNQRILFHFSRASFPGRTSSVHTLRGAEHGRRVRSSTSAACLRAKVLYMVSFWDSVEITFPVPESCGSGRTLTNPFLSCYSGAHWEDKAETDLPGRRQQRVQLRGRAAKFHLQQVVTHWKCFCVFLCFEKF